MGDHNLWKPLWDTLGCLKRWMVLSHLRCCLRWFLQSLVQGLG